MKFFFFAASWVRFYFETQSDGKFFFLASCYWAKLRRRHLRFPDFWLSLLKENCHNSRTSDDIDMKLGPVTKHDQKNKATSQKFDVMSCQKILMSLPFSQFTANLEQSRSRIP